jgi:hypothetical protein
MPALLLPSYSRPKRLHIPNSLIKNAHCTGYF